MGVSSVQLGAPQHLGAQQALKQREDVLLGGASRAGKRRSAQRPQTKHLQASHAEDTKEGYGRGEERNSQKYLQGADLFKPRIDESLACGYAGSREQRSLQDFLPVLHREPRAGPFRACKHSQRARWRDTRGGAEELPPKSPSTASVFDL